MSEQILWVLFISNTYVGLRFLSNFFLHKDWSLLIPFLLCIFVYNFHGFIYFHTVSESLSLAFTLTLFTTFMGVLTANLYSDGYMKF